MRLCIQWLLSLPIWRTALAAVSVTAVRSENPLSLSVFQHACATPLTTLLLDTDTLLSSQELDTQALNRMQVSAQRLRELFQSVNGTNAETFGVYDAIQEVRMMIGNRAAFSIHCAPAVRKGCRITGSKLLFTECLLCIVKNAIESYPDGSLKKIEIAIRTRSTGIAVSIRDYGRGMRPVEQFMARLQGVSCNKQSTGLGFPFSVRTLRKFFSGSVQLESAIGVGTKVSILLPNAVLHS